MITVNDTQAKYQPTTITVNANELRLENERLSEASEYPVVAALLITMNDMGSTNVEEEGGELAVDVQQFLEFLGEPTQVCASPELLSSLSSESLGLIFMAGETTEGIVITEDGVVQGPR